MESNNFIYKYLKFVSFSGLELWDTKRYNSKKVNSSFDLKQLYNCIIEQSTKYKIFEEKETEFKILGVNNKEGIFDAYILKGKDINQPYKKMQSGWIAYNPYRINVGSIGIKLNEHKYEYISPAYVVFSCKENLLPKYLFMIFKTELFNNIIKESTTGSVRQNLTFDSLKKLQIPLPSLEEQNRLVENYANKIKVAEEQEQEAGQLEHEIENYLLEELGVEKQMEEKKQPGKLIFVHFKDIKEWGIDKILRGNQEILKSKKYPNKKLSDYFFINPRTNLDQLNDNDEMSFIPMDCISDIYGEVIKIKEGKKKNSSGYTKFQENDLIWARITPCMQNGKSAIVKGLKNRLGYGSTEYHVIRKKSNDIILDFIYNILRTELIRGDAVNYFTGSAGQQRVPKSYLENLKIPLPPLEKQIEIVAYITNLKNKIKKLHILAKKNREEAIQEFEQEIFNS